MDFTFKLKERFIIVGIWNTVFGYLVFIFFDILFEKIFYKRYIAYMLAMILGQIIAIINDKINPLVNNLGITNCSDQSISI